MNFKNVKSIQFKLYLDGVGCVNFGSSEELDFLLRTGIVKWGDDGFVKNGKPLSNILLSKKNFRQNEDGTYEYHVKVSSECLRNNIFKDTMPFQSPTVMNLPQVLYRALANSDLILRGYLYTEKGGSSLKKKSPLYLTDAEEIGPWRKSITADFHSRSGEKESNTGKGSDDAKDTTIYKIENVGSTTYLATGGIDVTELRFISADPLYDRMAVNVDGGINEKIYTNELQRNMVNFTPEFKYYFLENSYTADEWAERGVLLNDESVDMLIKRLLKNMLNIEILRRNAHLRTNKLELTVNCTDGEQHIVEIHSTKDIDSLSFKCINVYKEADENKILENKKMIESLKSDSKKKSKNKTDKENV